MNQLRVNSHGSSNSIRTPKSSTIQNDDDEDFEDDEYQDGVETVDNGILDNISDHAQIKMTDGTDEDPKEDKPLLGIFMPTIGTDNGSYLGHSSNNN